MSRRALVVHACALAYLLAACDSESPVVPPPAQEQPIGAQLFEAMLPSVPFAIVFDDFQHRFDASAGQLGGDRIRECASYPPLNISGVQAAGCVFEREGFSQLAPAEVAQAERDGVDGMPDESLEVTLQDSGALLRVQFVGDSSTAARRAHYRLQLIAMLTSLGATREQAVDVVDDIDVTSERSRDSSVDVESSVALVSCFRGAASEFPATNCILEPPRRGAQP